MEFLISTNYDQKALTAMARALRKTIRKKHSKRSHLLGVLVCVLGIIFLLSASTFNLNFFITLTAVIAIIAALLFEDKLNGYVAKKRMLPGMDSAETVFRMDGYRNSTVIGTTDFPYDNILHFVQVDTYYVFIFSANHAQVYDGSNLSGGSHNEFEAFISEKTGCSFEKVKKYPDRFR